MAPGGMEMLKHGKRLYFKSEEGPSNDMRRIPSPDNPSGVPLAPVSVIDDGRLPVNVQPPAKEFVKPTRINLKDVAEEGTARHILVGADE